MSRKGLTDVEAASELGIKKMLSGSFVLVSGKLRVETHIVDLETGIMESSYTTTRDESDLSKLQIQLTQGVVAHLNLPITGDERRTLLAQQATDAESLKLLLEAEAGGAAAAQPIAVPTPQRGSALRRWLPRAAQASAGYAAETPVHETDIRAVLERYRQATEGKEIQALAAVYTEFSPEQQAAQQRYFDNVRDLRVALGNVDIAVVGEEAVVSYTRTDDFLDVRTGRPMHVAVRRTKILRKVDGEWKLAGGK